MADILGSPAQPMKKPGRFRRPGFLWQSRVKPGMTGPAYLLLLLPLDFFSPLVLLRLLELVLPLARSLWASLFWLLALAPLLAASERPLLPGEDLEVRDAIEMLLDSDSRPAQAAPNHRLTLGADDRFSVGCDCALL